MFEWAWTYVTGKRGARLITGQIEKPVSDPPSPTP